MCLNDADGMANSVDPDQVWSGSDMSVQKFRNITVCFVFTVRVGSEFWKQQEKFGDDLTGVQ